MCQIIVISRGENPQGVGNNLLSFNDESVDTRAN